MTRGLRGRGARGRRARGASPGPFPKRSPAGRGRQGRTAGGETSGRGRPAAAILQGADAFVPRPAMSQPSDGPPVPPHTPTVPPAPADGTGTLSDRELTGVPATVAIPPPPTG